MEAAGSVEERRKSLSTRNISIAVSLALVLIFGGCIIYCFVNRAEYTRPNGVNLQSPVPTNSKDGFSEDTELQAADASVVLKAPVVQRYAAIRGTPLLAATRTVQEALDLILELDPNKPVDFTHRVILCDALESTYRDTPKIERLLAVELFMGMVRSSDSLSLAMNEAKVICREGRSCVRFSRFLKSNPKEYWNHVCRYMTAYVEGRIHRHKDHFVASPKAETRRLTRAIRTLIKWWDKDAHAYVNKVQH